MNTSQPRDRDLVCRLCGEDFVFSAGEQELQRVRGIDLEPPHCPVCRRRDRTGPHSRRNAL